MSEVKEQWVAGPFNEILFQNFIQSPIGLVPKKGSSKTRLIFHLSYNFTDAEGSEKSLNFYTPKELYTTHYNDLDHAVINCLRVSGVSRCPLVLAKTDLVSAFRMLPIWDQHWRWVIFKAKDPETGETKYFVDKCLPFITSISCSHYQRFSNAIKHIAGFLTGCPWTITNYLDDFLFIETS